MQQLMLDPNASQKDLVIASVAISQLAKCSRFSDLGNCVDYEIEKDRVVVQVSVTKTSGKMCDRLPLLLVGPDKLLLSSKWFESFLELRKTLGIPFPHLSSVAK